MKKMELTQMASIVGGKFWGTGEIRHDEMCIVQNTYTVCSQDYMFWIKVGGEYNCQTVACPGYWEETIN